MHERESQDQLAKRIQQAEQQVTVGARYMHYKQCSYKVLAIGLREEDNQPCVIYQAEYGARVTFIRPVASWVEMVTVDGKQTPRFSQL